MLLATSLIALFVGPLLYRILRSRAYFLAGIDGFVVVVITGIVLIEVMPGALERGAVLSLLFLALGLLGPTVLERLFHRSARRVHRTTLYLGLTGLILHTVVDGMALLGLPMGHAGAAGDSLLPLGVILHRIPVGLTVWWLLRPMFGTRWALGVLGLMVAGTLTGYFAGAEVLLLVREQEAAWFQAFVAGSILHVVFHRPHAAHAESHAASHAHLHEAVHTHEAAPEMGHAHAHEAASERRGKTKGRLRWAEGSGNLVGLGILTALIVLHPHGHAGEPGYLEQVSHTLLHLALESAPALLLAYLAGGLITELLPASYVRWMGRGSSFGQAARGMAVGLPLPICTCGVLPLYRTLVRQGAPPTAAMAFLIATPELGIDAILISLPLLGGPMSALRVGAAALVALGVGWGVGTWAQRTSPAAAVDAAAACGCGSDGCTAAAPKDEEAPLGRRFIRGLRGGFGGLVDDTAAWILVGLLIAACLQPALDAAWLQALPAGLEVAFFALLGMPIYVCATGATPIVAVLIAGGVSPGAALAFLLTGPATNVSTFGILRSLHGPRIALVFGVATAAAAIALGYLVDAWLPNVGAGVVQAGAGEEAGPLQIVSLILLVGVYLFSMLRRGARTFFSELMPRTAHVHPA